MKERVNSELSSRPYFVGFGLSLLFTLSAYLAVTHRIFNRRTLIVTMTVLALAQFIAQMIFFLHLGKEQKPRWKFIVFISMIILVVILVFGSIWIMNNLNYNTTTQQVNQYLNNQGDGI